MMRSPILLLLVIAALLATSCDKLSRVFHGRAGPRAAPTSVRAPERFWEKFPQPEIGRPEQLHSVGIDAHNGLWIIAGNSTYFWDRQKQCWTAPLLPGGQYLTQFYGGPKMGLYVTQRGEQEHWAELLLLDQGRVKPVTRVYYDVSHWRPGFHVSGDGRMLNWGGGSLRICDEKGEWNEHPAELPQVGPLVLEGQNAVTLYYNGRLYIAGKGGAFSRAELNLPIDADATRATVWRGDVALLIESRHPRVWGFEVETGRPFDTTAIAGSLGGRVLHDMTSTPDGSVWIITSGPAPRRGGELIRLAPDGTVASIKSADTIRWGASDPFLHKPAPALMDERGGVWFATWSMACYVDPANTLHRFDHRWDNSPKVCRSLVQDTEGVIYAAGTAGLYAYTQGRSLTGRPPPPPVPMFDPGSPAWVHGVPPDDGLGMAWQIRDLVFYATRRGGEIIAIDPRDGSQRFRIAGETRRPSQKTWVAAGPDPAHLLICVGDRILTVDARTGAIVRTLQTNRDPRIAPVPIGDDLALVRQARGQSISRVTPAGIDAWTCTLSGYLQGHPSAHGSLLLAQTRQGSYGGQATHAVDLATGAKLWSDVVEAYGAGTAFADGARYCVEADSMMSPDAIEAWLIAREPRSGHRLWHYRKAGTTIDQAPWIDAGNDRVYAVLRNGTVVCLDGADGSPLWESRLPANAASAPGASYQPYHSCASSSDGWISVAAEDDLLYLLDTATGAIRWRIDLTASTAPAGNAFVPRPQIVAAPWIAGGRLLIATEYAILAYRLPQNGRISRPATAPSH